MQDRHERNRKMRDVLRYVKENQSIDFGELELYRDPNKTISISTVHSISSIIRDARINLLIDENEFEEWNLSEKGEKLLKNLENDSRL